MKFIVREFDRYVGDRMVLLPKALYRPLELLCAVVRPLGWAIVMLVLIIMSAYLDKPELLRLSLISIALLPLAEVMKLVFRRPRPLSIYTDSMRLKSYSFPSGHAYSTVLGCGYVALYASYFVFGGWLWLLYASLALLAVVVSLSRIYLKAHFPSDVMAGMILGVLAVVFLGTI